MTEINKYFVEITDTYGGEANYSWVRRYLVNAKTARGALRIVQRNFGGYWRADYYDADHSVYREKSNCLIMFIFWNSPEEAEDNLKNYSHIQEL